MEKALAAARAASSKLASDVVIPDLPGAQTILMSDTAGARRVVEAFRAGAADFLCKPLEDEETKRRLHEALQRRGIGNTHSPDTMPVSRAGKLHLLERAAQYG